MFDIIGKENENKNLTMKKKFVRAEISVILSSEDIVCTSGLDNELPPIPFEQLNLR